MATAACAGALIGNALSPVKDRLFVKVLLILGEASSTWTILQRAAACHLTLLCFWLHAAAGVLRGMVGRHQGGQPRGEASAHAGRAGHNRNAQNLPLHVRSTGSRTANGPTMCDKGHGTYPGNCTVLPGLSAASVFCKGLLAPHTWHSVWCTHVCILYTLQAKKTDVAAKLAGGGGGGGGGCDASQCQDPDTATVSNEHAARCSTAAMR